MNKFFSVSMLPCIVAVGMITLPGCSSTPEEKNEVRPSPVENKYVSVKFPEQITDCIVDKWQHIPFSGPLLSRKTQKGYVIIQNANGGIGADPAFITEVNDSPTGTEIIFHDYYPTGNDSSIYQDSVKGCQ